MAERLAGVAHRFTAINQGEAPLWPVNEATVAGFAIDQVEVGRRVQPPPAGPDLNTILPLVTGALFSDIDAKAASWQRFRPLPSACDVLPEPQAPTTNAAAEISPMLQAFRLACTNLQEIWSIVLPPHSLLALSMTFCSPTGCGESIADISSARLYRFTLHGWRATST
jgi:hypothetical protein